MANKKSTPFFTSDKLNLMLALCAILISSASFYATYLQADAAKKQVKAATWPWLTFNTGNYNGEEKTMEINFTIKNSGVGPALIKQFNYHYQGETFQNPYKLFAACCIKQQSLTAIIKEKDTTKFMILTSHVNKSILGSGEEIQSISFAKGTSPATHKFWDKLESERRNIKMSACYCSLLDECFVIKQGEDVRQVESCANYYSQ